MTNLRFQMSMESQQLSRFLVEHAQKQDYETVLTYEELSRIADCNVKEKRHVLDTARRVAERDATALYGVQSGVGIKLLTPKEQVGVGVNDVQHVKRHTTKALKRASCVEYEKLNNDDRIAHNVNASMLGALRLLGGKPTQKKIEGAVQQAQKKIPAKGLFKLFGHGQGDEQQ